MGNSVGNRFCYRRDKLAIQVSALSLSGIPARAEHLDQLDTGYVKGQSNLPCVVTLLPADF